MSMWIRRRAIVYVDCRRQAGRKQIVVYSADGSKEVTRFGETRRSANGR